MSCRDVRESLDALLDGEMEAGEELAVLEHLDWCRSCAEELEDLRDWHHSLADALSVEGARPSVAERRRTADAVIAAIRRPRVAPVRWAAVLAIGLSVGVVACAVTLSRPPREQIARVAERIRERESRDAQLRAMSAEIERDLGRAQRVVAERGPEDPEALAVAVGTMNIARRLGADPPPEAARVASELQQDAVAGERVSITRTVDGDTVSVTQLNDGRIRVALPGQRLEARSMEDLLSRHGDACRRYAIAGVDGFLAVGDSAAGTDWKGRLDLLLRTGAWDEAAQLEAYRGWVAARAPDAREIERRVRAHQERVRAATGKAVAAAVPVDGQAILKKIQTLTRGQLKRTQEQVESEMNTLDAKLQQAAELRDRARGLRIFAEDVSRD